MNSFKPKTVFIIEDNAVFSFWLNAQLDIAGNYRICSYSSAEDALNDLMEVKPSFIILDYNLGERMNGHEAIIKIKKLLPETYITILSQQKNPDITIDLIKSGADNYIIKNKEAMDTLKTLIESHCRN